jgi:hypothetical protein
MESRRPCTATPDDLVGLGAGAYFMKAHPRLRKSACDVPQAAGSETAS